MAKRFGDEVVDPNKRQKHLSGQPSKVLHVRGLPAFATESELLDVVSPHGEVIKLLMLTDKQQAFVQFESIEAATDALNSLEYASPTIRSKSIFFQYSSRAEIETKNASRIADPNNPGGSTDIPSPILLITVQEVNVPVTLENLYQICRPYGDVYKIVTFTKGNELQALVQMESTEAAGNAKLFLEGKDMFQGCCHIHVAFSKRTNLVVKLNDHKSRDFQVAPLELPGFYAPPPPQTTQNQNSFVPPVQQTSFVPPVQQQTSFAPPVQYGNLQTLSYPSYPPAPAPFPPSFPSSLPPPPSYPPGLGYQPSVYPPYQQQSYPPQPQSFPSQQFLPPAPQPYVPPPGSYPQSVGSAPVPYGTAPVPPVPAPTGNYGNVPPTGQSGTVVLVNKLSEDNKVTPDVLFNLFGVYGDVVRVKILHTKRDTAMVQFENAQSAELAAANLNGAPLFGQAMAVSPSVHNSIQLPKEQEPGGNLAKDFTGHSGQRYKGKGLGPKSIHAPSQVLHVANIHDNATSHELRQAFAPFQYICGAFPVVEFFKASRKLAYVGMGSVDEAVNALVHMHNAKFGPYPLRVSFSHKTPDAIQDSEQ